MIVTTWKTAKTELKEKEQKGMGYIHLAQDRARLLWT
jgi:hypothetical protein